MTTSPLVWRASGRPRPPGARMAPRSRHQTGRTESAQLKLGLKVGRQDGRNIPRQRTVHTHSSLVLQIADEATQRPVRCRVTDRVQISQGAGIQLCEVAAATAVNEVLTHRQPPRRRARAAARPIVNKRPHDARGNEPVNKPLPSRASTCDTAHGRLRPADLPGPPSGTRQRIDGHPRNPGATV